MCKKKKLNIFLTMKSLLQEKKRENLFSYQEYAWKKNNDYHGLAKNPNVICTKQTWVMGSFDWPGLCCLCTLGVVRMASTAHPMGL